MVKVEPERLSIAWCIKWLEDTAFTCSGERAEILNACAMFLRTTQAASASKLAIADPHKADRNVTVLLNTGVSVNLTVRSPLPPRPSAIVLIPESRIQAALGLSVPMGDRDRERYFDWVQFRHDENHVSWLLAERSAR